MKVTRWPVEPLTFSKKNPSRAIPRSTYIHPPSLAKIGQRTSEEIGNKQTDKQTNAARFIVWWFNVHCYYLPSRWQVICNFHLCVWIQKTFPTVTGKNDLSVMVNQLFCYTFSCFNEYPNILQWNMLKTIMITVKVSHVISSITLG